MAKDLLSAKRVESAPPGKYSDGDGLQLVVAKDWSRKWVLRYTINGRRREMGLGSFDRVSLKRARELRTEARDQIEAGIDPIEARKAAKRIREHRVDDTGPPTFTTCAARYIRAHRRGWRNRKHARQWAATLKTYARDVIGSKPVDAITTEDVLAILSGIWNSKTETAKRVQGRIENVLDYAAARKYRDAANPARWRGHLDKLLPKPTKVKKVTHHPAMPFSEVPAFMVELAENGSVSAQALRFMILTATRTGEVSRATWREIDLRAALWTIPAARMKAGSEHRVPLSEQAVALLRALPRVEGNPYVFPGARGRRSLSNMAMLEAMRGLGYGVKGARGRYVPHGFRSTFRDWVGEETSFPSDVAEMALAHALRDKTRAAYQRGDLFEKRRRMMQAWADYLEPRAANVVPIKKGGTA